MTDLDVLARDLGYVEGPAMLDQTTVAATSISNGAVYVIDADGSVTTTPTGGGANGLAVGPDGALYLANNGGIWGGQPGEAGIQRIAGGEVTYIATGLGAPNDICFGPDGRLWFTDSRSESDPSDPGSNPAGQVWSCATDGSDLQLALEGPAFINGLAFDPAGTGLYVVETARTRILRFDWADGKITGGDEAVALPAGHYPDGIALDVNGNLWVAATFGHGIYVFTPDGAQVGFLPTGEGSQPSNCCFGGIDGATLYVAASGWGSLLRGEIGTAGLPLYPFR